MRLLLFGVADVASVGLLVGPGPRPYAEPPGRTRFVELLEETRNDPPAAPRSPLWRVGRRHAGRKPDSGLRSLEASACFPQTLRRAISLGRPYRPAHAKNTSISRYGGRYYRLLRLPVEDQASLRHPGCGSTDGQPQHDGAVHAGTGVGDSRHAGAVRSRRIFHQPAGAPAGRSESPPRSVPSISAVFREGSRVGHGRRAPAPGRDLQRDAGAAWRTPWIASIVSPPTHPTNCAAPSRLIRAAAECALR